METSNTPLPIDLSSKSLRTTIGQLPLSDCKISLSSPVQRMIEAFNCQPDLPGIMIVDENRRIYGVASRKDFLEWAGAFQKTGDLIDTPIRQITDHLITEPLILPSTCSIQEASQASIKRAHERAYDPIVVAFPDREYNLILDSHLLLLVQAKLLTHSFKMEKSRRKLAETFYKAGRALSASLRLDQVLSIIFDFIGDFIEYDQAVALIRKKGVLEISASRGKYNDTYPVGKELFICEHPTLQQMVLNGELIVTGCLGDEQAIEILAKPCQSWIGIPLMNSDEVIAVFNIFHDTPGFYETQDISTVINFISQSSLAINNALLYSKMWEDANHDALTGLYNRRYFFESITSLLDSCKNAGQNLALLIIDLDHFKFINDHFGHQAGDELLRSVSAIINSCTRNHDFACRYGGEEFLIVLHDVSESTALEVAERLRVMINKQVFHFVHTDETAQTSISTGIAIFPDDGENIESLIHAADQALYQAKENRNCIRIRHKVL